MQFGLHERSPDNIEKYDREIAFLVHSKHIAGVFVFVFVSAVVFGNMNSRKTNPPTPLSTSFKPSHALILQHRR